LDQESFAELENLILTFQETSEADAMDFLNLSTRRNVGKVIRAKNYVGLIQIKNGTQIQILPKIDAGEEVDTKKTFLHMLRSMKDFPSKVFNDASLKLDRMNLYEIFINMYIQEVRSLVKKGIKSAYQPIEENANFYKGKLVVKEQIKQNIVHKERFYIKYDEFSVNRAENRLVKSTLLKLIQLSNSAANIKEMRQLLTNFEMVEPSVNYQKDFSKVVVDRNTKDYKILMQWSKVFLMNKSFTTFSGTTSSRALLFPMEKVFESYVAQSLKKEFADLDWDVSAQDKGYYLFNTPKNQFALRPDIVIRCEENTTIVLDTKWKSLINNPGMNYGISQADMYQMYAYSKKYKTPEIWLLYPINSTMKDAKNIEFISNEEERVTVKLFFVDVAHIEESLGELKQKLIKETVTT
jgi:5-methylcytosine-specific restriction enzyme subunit McrC